jgi:hypothetical protein
MIKKLTSPVHITASARKKSGGYQMNCDSPNLFNSLVIHHARSTPERVASKIGGKYTPPMAASMGRFE